MPNYFNPYYNGNYGYGNYQQPMQQQMYQNQYQQPMQQQVQMVQQPTNSFIPLTYTNGLVGAKAYILGANQTVYLKDSDEGSDLLFEKSADMQGKYTLNAYRLVPIELEDIGKPREEKKERQINYDDLATKNDLFSLKHDFSSKVDKLIDMVSKMPIKSTSQARKGGNDE